MGCVVIKREKEEDLPRRVERLTRNATDVGKRRGALQGALVHQVPKGFRGVLPAKRFGGELGSILV